MELGRINLYCAQQSLVNYNQLKWRGYYIKRDYLENVLTMDLNQLTEFLGWCAVINVSILALTTLLMFALRDFITRVHSQMFNIEPSVLPGLYFNYLAHFKLATLIFNIVPYFALKLIA